MLPEHSLCVFSCSSERSHCFTSRVEERIYIFTPVLLSRLITCITCLVNATRAFSMCFLLLLRAFTLLYKPCGRKDIYIYSCSAEPAHNVYNVPCKCYQSILYVFSPANSFFLNYANFMHVHTFFFTFFICFFIFIFGYF